MVKDTWQQFGFIFLLALFSYASLAEPQLILFTDKSESTIGRPIRADLYGISLNGKISDIKLNQLNENFGVVTDYIISETNDERWPNKTVQILKLKLYPRKVGTIIIPRISSNNTHSEEKTLIIKQGESGLPELTLSTSAPYERQQIIAQFSIISNNPTSRLSLKENIVIHGFESHPLPFKRTQIKEDVYHLQIGLALSALKNGPLKLDLPPVEYSVSGVSRKQYYFPAEQINVKTLPLYLPPTVPVGNIIVQSQLSSTKLLKSDSLYYWNINLKGELNNTYQLPAILRQIKSNSQIKFFPANSKRSRTKTSNSLTSIVNHSIPFKVFASGSLTLPEIQLQYFDPLTGKLVRKTHQAETIFVLSYLWRIIFLIITIIILGYIIILSYKKWLRIKFSKLKREKAVQLLDTGRDIRRIRESIFLLSEAEYWSKNITVSQWAGNWKRKYQVSDNFEELIGEISFCLYGSNKECDTMKISTQLLALIKERKKW